MVQTFLGPEGSRWELLPILAVIALILGDPRGRVRHPVLLGAAALIFAVGLHPALDTVARYSVWLHSLQSLLIHHLGPLLLIRAHSSPCRLLPGSARALRSAPATVLVLFSFIAMTLVWLSPDLHLPLMDSAALYSAMKWGMAISGILLCASVGDQSDGGRGGIARDPAIGFLVAVPQAMAGLYLLVHPPLYPMLCLSAPVTWLPVLDPLQDQQLGGVLLIAASALFFLGDPSRRRRRSAAIPQRPAAL